MDGLLDLLSPKTMLASWLMGASESARAQIYTSEDSGAKWNEPSPPRNTGLKVTNKTWLTIVQLCC